MPTNSAQRRSLPPPVRRLSESQHGRAVEQFKRNVDRAQNELAAATERAEGRNEIVVQDADYDESRSVPVRVRSCLASADLDEHGVLEVRVEDSIQQEGRVCFSINAGAVELVLTDLAPRDLATVITTIESAVASARRRGIVRGGSRK